MPKSTKLGLTKDDFEDKKFKVAPGGRYKVKISKGGAKGTSIKTGASGDGLNVHATITSGKHKGVTFFDWVGASVGWKIAQLLKALGLTFGSSAKKVKTLQDLLTLVAGKELEAVLRVGKYNGQDKNEVVQWLPLGAEDEEDDEDSEEEEDDDDEDAADEDDEGDEEDEDDEEAEEDDEDDADDDDESDDDESDDEDEDEVESDEEDDEEDDDEGDEEDEEEEEEPVKKPAKKTTKKPAPARRKK